MDVQVIAVRYPTFTVSKVPHGLKSVKRFSFVSDVDMSRLVTMRPTEEVDPRTLRELLKKQRRLATGSEQQPPEPRPTVQISRDELLGLRDQCSDAPVISVEPAHVESEDLDRDVKTVAMEPLVVVAPGRREPRARKLVIGTAIACLATLWLVATGWLLATW
jgi:hypothetical protein